MPIEQWSADIWINRVPEKPGMSEDLDTLLYAMKEASTTPHLVVDLSNVPHVTSSNLSQMLRLRKLAIDKDVKMRIVGPRDSVWAIFLTTGLDKVFEFSPDISVALADLQINT